MEKTPPLFPHLQELCDKEPQNGPWHMAADEWLLHSMEADHLPAVRFYRWQRPEVTFGYFLDEALVEQECPGWQRTRRWTGGGIVRHGEDVTFSLILPRGCPLAQASGHEIYAAIHQCIVSAWPWELEEIGLVPEAESENLRAKVCFQAPVRADVIRHGLKVAGGAMRRTRRGLLYQGSIRAIGCTDHAEGREQLEAALRRQLAEEITLRSWNESERASITHLEQQRYATMRKM